MRIVAQFIARRILWNKDAVLLTRHGQAELLGWVGCRCRLEPSSTCAIVICPSTCGDARGRNVALVETGDGVAGTALGYPRLVAQGLVDCAHAFDVSRGDLSVVWIGCSIRLSDECVLSAAGECITGIVHDRFEIVRILHLVLADVRVELELVQKVVATGRGRAIAAVGAVALVWRIGAERAGFEGFAVKRDPVVAVGTFVLVEQPELVTPFVFGLASETSAGEVDVRLCHFKADALESGVTVAPVPLSRSDNYDTLFKSWIWVSLLKAKVGSELYPLGESGVDVRPYLCFRVRRIITIWNGETWPAVCRFDGIPTLFP